MSRLHGVLETVWPFASKLSRLDACEDRKVVRWCRTQASCHNSQGVNVVGVSTATPHRSTVLRC